MVIRQVGILSVAGAIATTSIFVLTKPVYSQARPLPDICYSNNGRFFAEFNREVCDYINLVNPQNVSSPTATPTNDIDYILLGRAIQTIYETEYTRVWDDGARGFIDENNSVRRITKQVADDGNVVYYFRADNSNRIYRYNASNDSTGYIDVWSYSIGNRYLNCRVTMLTDDGRYLDSPQITNVETNNMYPAIGTLLSFQAPSI